MGGRIMKHVLAFWSLLPLIAAALLADADDHHHHVTQLVAMANSTNGTRSMEEYIHNLMQSHQSAAAPAATAVKIKQYIDTKWITNLTAHHKHAQDAMFESNRTFFEKCYMKHVSTTHLTILEARHRECRNEEAYLYHKKIEYCEQVNVFKKQKELTCEAAKECEKIPQDVPAVCKKLDDKYSVTNEEEGKRVRDYFQDLTVDCGSKINDCENNTNSTTTSKWYCYNYTVWYGNKTEECDEIQHLLEIEACSDPEPPAITSCHKFEECWRENMKLYELFNNTIAAGELSRQTQWKGLQHIKCFLACYESSTTNHAACKQACRDKDHLVCDVTYPTTTTTTQCWTRDKFPYKEEYVDNASQVFSDSHNYKVIAYTKHDYGQALATEEVCIKPPIGCGGGCSGQHKGQFDITYLYCDGSDSQHPVPPPPVPPCPKSDFPVPPCGPSWYPKVCHGLPSVAPCADPISTCCTYCDKFIEHLGQCPSGVAIPHPDEKKGFSETECCDGVHWHAGRWSSFICLDENDPANCDKDQPVQTRKVVCAADLQSEPLDEKECENMTKPASSREVCPKIQSCVQCVDNCPDGYYLKGCNGFHPGKCEKCTYERLVLSGVDCTNGCYFTSSGGLEDKCDKKPCTEPDPPCDVNQYLEGCGGIAKGVCRNCTADCRVGYYKDECGNSEHAATNGNLVTNPGVCKPCVVPAGKLASNAGEFSPSSCAPYWPQPLPPTARGEFVVDLFKEEIEGFVEKDGYRCTGNPYTEPTSNGCDGFTVDTLAQCIEKCNYSVIVPNCPPVTECQAVSWDPHDKKCHLYSDCGAFEAAPEVISAFKRHYLWNESWQEWPMNSIPQWTINATVASKAGGFESLSYVRLTPNCNRPESEPGNLTIELYLEQGKSYNLEIDAAWWPMSGKAVKGSLDCDKTGSEGSSVLGVAIVQEGDTGEPEPIAARVNSCFDRVFHLDWQRLYFQILPSGNFVNVTITEGQYNCIAIKSAVLWTEEVSFQAAMDAECKASKGECSGANYARKQLCEGSGWNCNEGTHTWQCHGQVDTTQPGAYCAINPDGEVADCSKSTVVDGQFVCDVQCFKGVSKHCDMTDKMQQDALKKTSMATERLSESS